MQKRIRSYVQARNEGRIPGVDGALKPEASQILFQAFIQGALERSTALEMTGASESRTARRLIKQLKDDGLLSETNQSIPSEMGNPGTYGTLLLPAACSEYLTIDQRTKSHRPYWARKTDG